MPRAEWQRGQAGGKVKGGAERCSAAPVPQLLHNFIYKEFSAGSFTSVGDVMDLLRLLCSRDLTIAQV